MDDKLLIALVAAVSALIGSAIPTLFNYWNNSKQREFEVKKALLEKQRQIYSDLMLCLQQMINTNKNEDFFGLQRAVLQVSIYGDDSTSSALNEYYTAIIASAQHGGTPLEKTRHQYHQNRILNGMRASLDLQPLPAFEIVSFRPPAEISGT
jgi:hypothetical protein